MAPDDINLIPILCGDLAFEAFYGVMDFKTWLAAIGAAALRPLPPLDMYDTTVMLKPREQWRPGMICEKLIHLVGGNLNHRGNVAAAMPGVDAMASVVPLVTSYDPPEAFDTQLGGIKNVIDAAVEAGVRQFVLCSANSGSTEPRIWCWQAALKLS